MRKTALKKELESREMTATELARRTKLSPRTVQAIAQGARKPNLQAAQRIERALRGFHF